MFRLALVSACFVVSLQAQEEEEVKCKVPWPTFGRWVNCIPETIKKLDEECTFEKKFGTKCTYEDGPIKCNREGKFEQFDGNDKAKGPNMCTVIPYPPDGGGCARYDRDYNTCIVIEGCKWEGERSWCQTVCHKIGCMTELHRRDVSCYFNCPLHDAKACTPWQAGCTCIQDTRTTEQTTEIADCQNWCLGTNTEVFTWLPTATTPSESYLDDSLAPEKKSAMMTIGDSLDTTNEEAYDPKQLCLDACFQRGVCVSPRVTVF